MGVDVSAGNRLPNEVGHPAVVNMDDLQVDADGRARFSVYGSGLGTVPCYFSAEVLGGLARRAGVASPARADAVAVREILAVLGGLGLVAVVRFATVTDAVEVVRVLFVSDDDRVNCSVEGAKIIPCHRLDGTLCRLGRRSACVMEIVGRIGNGGEHDVLLLWTRSNSHIDLDHCPFCGARIVTRPDAVRA